MKEEHFINNQLHGLLSFDKFRILESQLNINKVEEDGYALKTLLLLNRSFYSKSNSCSLNLLNVSLLC
jgi:hypothetical protein